MTALDVVREVRVLLSDRNKWTQSKIAADVNGYLTPSDSPAACKWCLRGAINKVCNQKAELIAATVALLSPHTRHSLTAVNDYEGYDTVLAVLDKALVAGATS